MRSLTRDVSPPTFGRMGDRMKGPEGPGRKGNQPQNESEADFHSRDLTGLGGCGNGWYTIFQMVVVLIYNQSRNSLLLYFCPNVFLSKLKWRHFD